MQLSKYFTLEDLTVTSHTEVNNQPDTFALENLKRVALLLDLIYDQIGPFRVTSGYRSPELNRVLAGDHPVSTTSYHMRGLAADMRPENDTPFNFFVKILNSPIFSSVGELINEADEQGIVHVSLPTPEKTSVAMYLKNGSYYRYTQDEIDALRGGDEVEGSDTYYDSEADAGEESVSNITLIAVTVAIFAVASVFLASRRHA